MSILRSEQFRLALAKETTYGTAPTTGFIPIGLLKGYEPPDPSQEWLSFKRLGVAGSRHVEHLVSGKRACSGSIPFTLQDGRMFALALGLDTVSGTAPYVHTITEAESLPSFTLMVSRLMSGVTDDEIRKYVGTKINSFSIASEDSGELKGTASIISQDMELVMDEDAPDLIAMDDEPYWFDKATITFWGTEIGRCQSFELSINNSLKPKRYHRAAAQGNTLTEIIEGTAKYTCKATITVDDWTIMQQLLAKTPFDITISYARETDDTLTITSDVSGTGDGNCQIEKAPYSIPETDEINVPVEIVIKHLKVIVENDVATSYTV